jgi:hypothetical protein
MTVIGLMSGKGSPGVTSTAVALALTWPLASHIAPDATPVGAGSAAGRVLVVDADPAGCGIGIGYFRGAVPGGGGLLAVANALDADLGDVLADQVVALDDSGTRLLLPGISDPLWTASVTGVWPALARSVAAISEAGVDVLIDLGRIGTAAAPTALLEAADALVVVARSSLLSIAGARAAVRHVQQVAVRVGVGELPLAVLLVGPDRPYSRAEIARSLDVGVVGVLAWDPASAAVLSDGEPAGWGFARSRLLRSARGAAAAVAALPPDRARSPKDVPHPKTRPVAGPTTGPGRTISVAAPDSPGGWVPSAARSDRGGPS